jgi:hypothetical protein
MFASFASIRAHHKGRRTDAPQSATAAFAGEPRGPAANGNYIFRALLQRIVEATAQPCGRLHQFDYFRLTVDAIGYLRRNRGYCILFVSFNAAAS